MGAAVICASSSCWLLCIQGAGYSDMKPSAWILLVAVIGASTELGSYMIPSSLLLMVAVICASTKLDTCKTPSSWRAGSYILCIHRTMYAIVWCPDHDDCWQLFSVHPQRWVIMIIADSSHLYIYVPTYSMYFLSPVSMYIPWTFRPRACW